jgi:hypothetical protein
MTLNEFLGGVSYLQIEQLFFDIIMEFLAEVFVGFLYALV